MYLNNMLCRQDVFQSYYSLISNNNFYTISNDSINFNPIIVLFLTRFSEETDNDRVLFQSYYSLISNSYYLSP